MVKPLIPRSLAKTSAVLQSAFRRSAFLRSGFGEGRCPDRFNVLLNRFWVSCFACVNVALVGACIHYYPEARRALVIPYSILLLLLAVLLVLNVIPFTARHILSALRGVSPISSGTGSIEAVSIKEQGESIKEQSDALEGARSQAMTDIILSPETLVSLSVLGAFVAAISGIAGEFMTGTGLEAAQQFPFFMLLLALMDLAHQIAVLRVERGHAFSLEDLVPSVRISAGEDAKCDTFRPLHDLKKNDHVCLRAGDVVPADSVVVSGEGEVLERRHDFAGARRYKQAGQEVFAASELRDGNMTIRTLDLPGRSDISGYFEQMNKRSGNILAARAAALERCLTLLVFSAGVGTLLFWMGRGEPFLQLASLFAATMLLSALTRTLPLIISVLGWTFSVIARRGILLRDPSRAIPALRRIRTLLIDFSFDEPPGDRGVKDLLLLDSRLEEMSVLSVLFSLFSASESSLHQGCARLLNDVYPRIKLFPVHQMRMLSGEGIGGVVEGASFLVGREESLISEKVHFELADATEPDNVPDVTWFMALEGRPIARFHLAEPFELEGRRLTEDLSGMGIRTVLVSAESSEKLDHFGKKIGLELSSISGGLSAEGLEERVKALKPSGLLINSKAPLSLAALADATLAVFNPLKHDYSAADAVISKGSILSLPQCLRIIRIEGILRALLLSLGAIILVTCIVLSLGAQLSLLFSSIICALWAAIVASALCTIPVR